MWERAARVALLAIVALLASCGGRSADFYVESTGVVVDTAAPFARQADFPARVRSSIEAALAYWGGTWRDLDGTTITLVDEQYVSCGGSSHAIGCSEGREIRVSTRDPTLGTWSCVEQTVLVHEIGHSVLGDPWHTDPRWMDFVPMIDSIGEPTGYTAEGEVPCPLYLSVWRHPLGSQ